MRMPKKKVEKKTKKERVEERREEVLAKGRKFKYPLQLTRHRIVINTIIIAVLVCAFLVVGGWAALYRLGRTDALLFNVTKVIPLAVANVDGENVPFADYLMLYRSSMTSAERQSGGQISASNDTLAQQYKRTALTESEKYVYAQRLAAELGVDVSDEEVASEFERHLKIGGVDRSEEGFIKIISDNFGLSKAEYERMLYLTLLRAKVEMAIDTNANSVADQVERLLAENGGDYAKVAEALGAQVEYEDTGGLVDGKNVDGGRATVAMQLEPGQSSGKFVSMNGDGYYFVKLVDKTDSKVNFVSIKVPFREFENRFSQLGEDGKIVEFIEVEEGE